jgi:hypothetical protein
MEWFYSVVNFDMNFVLVRQKIPNNKLSCRQKRKKEKKKPKKKNKRKRKKKKKKRNRGRGGREE